MKVERITDGLWRWTAPHPDWNEGDDWPRDVGCVYWEGAEATVLVDPLVPEDVSDRDRFHAALDRDVERMGLPVAILQTCRWHGRSVRELAARYQATVHATADDAGLPAGVRGIAAPSADEVVWWLEGARAVVPGDTLLGDDVGGVTVCPASWLDAGDQAELATQLAPLLALPCERILVSHGRPVLVDGGSALRRALDC
ncbi:MAG: MBL fold metallo-hydrolase [Thermoleophilia bacterium]|nr:MBL fold metallo-hydrolase [Thermoleophilia bacterium]